VTDDQTPVKSAKKPRKPGARKRGTARTMLLQAARDVMAESNDVDVPLSRIAARCGLNSALVKYYFGNRQGLLFALMDDILSRGIHQMQELSTMEMDPVEKLKLHIRGMVTVYFRYPFINRVFHKLFLDPEFGDKMATQVSTPLTMAQKALLTEAVEAGMIKPIEPMYFYFIVVGACDHLFFGHHVMRAAYGIDRIDDALMRDYANVLIDLIMNGLRIDPTAVTRN
jgi:AcrR family transcriptional regulator